MVINKKIKYGDFSVDDLIKCINPDCNNVPVKKGILCATCVNKDILIKINWLNLFEENRLKLNDLLKISEIENIIKLKYKSLNPSTFKKKAEDLFIEYNSKIKSKHLPTSIVLEFNKTKPLKLLCLSCKNKWDGFFIPRECPKCKKDNIERLPLPLSFNDRISLMCKITSLEDLKKKYTEKLKSRIKND